jgi:hypothetical protein
MADARVSVLIDIHLPPTLNELRRTGCGAVPESRADPTICLLRHLRFAPSIQNPLWKTGNRATIQAM